MVINTKQRGPSSSTQIPNFHYFTLEDILVWQSYNRQVEMVTFLNKKKVTFTAKELFPQG